MTAIFRTPDERFDGLPGYPFDPHYAEVDGMRLHYVDEGEGNPVWFMHGEPTWSYLWRKVMPPVRDAGFRCIAPDMPGFGRSDKPTDQDWYSYDAHTGAMGSLLEQLDLHDVTFVVHDWGGPVALRLAVEHPDRVARLVILDTGLFTGRQKMSDAWVAFRDFVQRTEDLPIGFLVKGACARDMPHDVFSAYEAPFPTTASKAGARAFPLILPTSPDAPGAEAGQRVLDALPALDVPKLALWADKDPVLTLDTGKRFAAAVGAPEPEVIEDASHFLQEDAGEEIGQRIAAWLRS
ncbi:MAG: haloalkane dehalogenase [Solirubrobacteraceae bacterium]|nr:haloalkane dehalogenase [Solirubrobacteraceae bacterium]